MSDVPDTVETPDTPGPPEPTAKPARRPRPQVFCVIVFLIGLGAGLASVFGLMSWLWWPFELMCHFRVQYAITLALLSVVLLLLRTFRLAAILCVLAVLNFVMLFPLYLPPPRDVETVPLRVILSNVNYRNADPARLLACVKRENPDFVLLLETTPDWLEKVSELEKRYPYRVGQGREDSFGIMLYSKVPFVQSRVLDLGQAGVPSVTATVRINEQLVTIVGTHPVPPVGARQVRLRNGQFHDVANEVLRTPQPVLLLGDLNCTRWSQAFGLLLWSAGLRNSEDGFGYQPTWPTRNPLLRIPTDHCLYTPGIEIADRRVGPRIGSDHFPLIVDFALSGL